MDTDGGSLWKMIEDIITAVVKSRPEIKPYLSNKARWYTSLSSPEPFKTWDFMLHAIERLVINTYNGLIAGDFIDVMANLISGQIYDAYESAWRDDGNDPPLPWYLSQAADNDILKQYDYVDQYYRDIIDARVDKTPLQPLLSRAQLWANRYNESYNNAVHIIQLQEGGKEMWVIGATEKHCETCTKLDGVVAYAKEWEASRYKPQGSNLSCGGWRCDCSLTPTENRLTRNRKSKLEIR